MAKKPNLAYRALGVYTVYDSKGSVIRRNSNPYIWYQQSTAGNYTTPNSRVCKGYRAQYSTSGLWETWDYHVGAEYYLSGYGYHFGFDSSPSLGGSWTGSGSLAENQRRLQSQQVNVAMVVRDLKDANKMALGYFKRVNNCIKFVKKGKWKKALNAFLGNRSKVKAAANNWLEFQFGVLPTIHSVQDAYRVVSQRLKSDNKLLRLSVTSTRHQQMLEDTPNRKVYGHFDNRMDYLSLRYYSKKDTFNLLLNTNLIEARWDLVPYSFLIDWFTPIGEYINQFGTLAHTTSDGCDTVRWTNVVKATREEWQGKYLRSKYHFDHACVNVNRTVNRSIDYSMSFSELLNRSGLGISCHQAANAYALLAQRVPR
jgi:hypothetical protein